MQKRLNAQHKRIEITRSGSRRMSSRGGMGRAFVIAFCFIVFVGVFGLATAAHASGGSSTALTQKEQHIQQLLATGRANIHAKSAGQNLVPAVQAAPVRQAGIINMQQGPFQRSVFTVRNVWQGPVNSDWVLAYAGAKTNVDGTAGQGGIVLYTETINSQGGFDLQVSGTFLAPAGTTALTISSVSGNLLLLTDSAGNQLTFNLATHQFQ